MEKEKGIWVTKDGREIKIGDMDNDHLINSINMLKRSAHQMRLNHEVLGYSMLGIVNGDMAQYAIENELFYEGQMSDEEWLECYTLYGKLMEEVRKRNIAYYICAPFFEYMDTCVRSGMKAGA